MITLVLKKWPTLSGPAHTGTSWQIYTDVSLSNIVLDIVNSISYVDVLYNSLIIPDGYTYYARVKRHFSDGSSSDWSTPIAVTDTKSNAFNINIEVRIDTPVVGINKNALTDNSITDIIITSTEFISNIETHHSTHYIITDELDNILWYRLNDTINLNSITIPKSEINYATKRAINFYVIYNTLTGISSQPGVHTENININNYRIVSSLDRVSARVNYPIQIRRIDQTQPLGIVRYELKDITSDEILASGDISDPDPIITILGASLAPMSNYRLNLTIIQNNGEYAIDTYIITTLDTQQSNNIDINFKYENVLTELNNSTFNLPNNFDVTEWANNYIPIPEYDGNIIKLYRYNQVTDTMFYITDITGITIPGFNYNNVWIRLTSDNKILMDVKNEIGIPTLFVYNYNSTTHNATLINVIVRNGENRTFAETGSAHILDNATLLYMDIDTYDVKLIDINNGTITTRSTIDIDHTFTGVFINIFDNRFLFIGGDEVIGYIYILDSNVWLPAHIIPPDFRSKDIKAIQLLDGSTMIYRKQYNIGDNTDILVLRNIDNELTRHSISDVMPDNTANGNCLLRSGKLLLTSYDNIIPATRVYQWS